MKYNNITRACLYGLLGLLSVGVAGCSDDDDAPKTPISTPGVHEPVITPTTVTFSWDKVADVLQYGYELKDASDTHVAGGVTDTNSATITQLTPASSYVLTVWAYAPATSDEKGNSNVVTIQVNTPAQQRLAAPAPSVVENGNKLYVTWDAVPNAESYHYVVVGDASLEGDVDSPYALLQDLPLGDYRISVSAQAPSADWYTESAEGEAFGSRVNTRSSRYQGTCVMEDYPDSSWSAPIEAYSDGSFSVKSWYAAEGYDIDFKVLDDGTTVLLNCPYIDGYYYISYDGTDMGYFSNPEATIGKSKGSLKVNEYYSGNITFSWGGR